MRKEDKAGLYITVIFHLTVIIILLLAGISRELSREQSFVMDFSAIEEVERLQKELEFKEEVSKRLEEMIRNAEISNRSEIRNYAVDRGSSTLKDDRNTDADQLYKDAQRLDDELTNGQKSAISEDAREETVELTGKKADKAQSEQREYSGPSVLSYNLDGRKASHLKIPAYRCYGEGEVTVIITVDNAGNVIAAKIKEEVSSSDDCLCKFAIRAARLSKFSASTTAPARQLGDIVYKFIAQ
jgi:hypothetical protein